MTKKLGSTINSAKEFNKSTLHNRTKDLSEFCSNRWWSEKTTEAELSVVLDGEYNYQEVS